MRTKLNEIKRMQQLAGVINENQIASSNFPSKETWELWLELSNENDVDSLNLEDWNEMWVSSFIKELQWIENNKNKYNRDELSQEFSDYLTSSFDSPINEVELSRVDKKMKDKYIQDYISYVTSDEDSEFNDDIADLDTIEKHAEEFGYTNTLKTIDKMNNDYSQNSNTKDPLQRKAVGNNFRREPVITKKGKMHKYDVEFIKDKIKSNLGLDY
jgi:hypothetical protein